MRRPAWFKHEPNTTATGYRWLDLLTAPYWFIADWRARRRFWNLFRVGNESIRETKQWVRAVWDMPERLTTDELQCNFCYSKRGVRTYCPIHDGGFNRPEVKGALARYRETARPWFYRWACSCGSVGRTDDAGLAAVRAFHRGHDLSIEGAGALRTTTHDPVSGQFYVGPVEPGRYLVVPIELGRGDTREERE